jgi:hypothetical protein
MSHVVLLGDSIFDNASYVPGGPAVIDHLRKALPAGWKATLLAVDGDVVDGVPRQLSRLPNDATHLVVSVGGNDALGYAHFVLTEPADAYSEALARMGEIRDGFQQDYRRMLKDVVARGKPTAVCTVYDSIPDLPPAAQVGLSLFNDAIVREAAAAGVPVLDLRLVCTAASDYSSVSPIEPSAGGGAKIAFLISQVVTKHDFADDGCRVYS